VKYKNKLNAPSVAHQFSDAKCNEIAVQISSDLYEGAQDIGRKKTAWPSKAVFMGRMRY
jgi:hypothetical protein